MMVRKSALIAFAAGSLTFFGQGPVAHAAKPNDTQTAETQINPHYGERVRGRVINNEDERVGDIWAWQGNGGVLLQVRLHGLPSGAHGIHIHQTGSCGDIGAFKESGGHVGKSDAPHGILHPGGPHKGDLPDIFVNADGTAKADIFSPLINITDFRDIDGAAIIIHTAGDDYQTQPIGNAGKRIACSVFPGR
jgi:Cu-Zn family superoxide dismutase